MICEHCKWAGKVLDDSRQPDGTVGRAKIIAQIHAQCRGGTWCDCQHKLAYVINPKYARA